MTELTELEEREPEVTDSETTDDLAELAGFESEEPSDPVSQAELFEPVQDPHEAKTKPTLASNPLAKAGLVGAGLMVVFGVGGFFAAQLVGVDLKKAPSLVKEKPPETQLVKRAEEDEDEIGELKTQLAIASQERQLKAVDESKKPRVSPKPTPSPAPVSTPRPKQVSPPPRTTPPSPPQRVVPPPPRRTAPLPPPKRVVPSSPQLAPKPETKPESKPEPESESDPKLEPEVNLQTLAMIGSYGGSSTALPASPVVQADETTASGIMLQVGQMASAEIITPVVCLPNQRFVAELTEPIADGWELLPAQTQVIFTCDSIAENGMVQLNAIAFSNGETQSSIPPGAVSIRGEGGQPLVAEIFNSHDGEIAKRDRTLFITGALSRVGEVLNEPKSQSSVVTSGGTSQTSSTVTSSDPDILGAVLDGGFNPLTEQISERNQQELERLLSQEKIWFVPAKTQVQVFVNQLFSL